MPSLRSNQKFFKTFKFINIFGIDLNCIQFIVLVDLSYRVGIPIKLKMLKLPTLKTIARKPAFKFKKPHPNRFTCLRATAPQTHTHYAYNWVFKHGWQFLIEVRSQ